MRIALAFDVYGTLIDTAGVVAELRALVGNRAEAFSALWREKQLEYSFRRALMRRYAKFSVCVSESLDYVSARLDVSLADEDRARVLGVFGALPAFDDVDYCLARLDIGEFGLYALSNGSRDAVEKLLENAGINERFADIVSVDEIETFKPDPAVYEHFLKRAGVDGSHAWLISGNPFDVIGAQSAGMNGVWVKRSLDAVYDPWGVEPTLTASSLAELGPKLQEFLARSR
ncbi:MAG TPA: haloacid dehalogenase type II [Gammaproteobacteria bacterium]|nr:haloacid dehalogenase type II [Gammaproteobacteria bacterium]